MSDSFIGLLLASGDINADPGSTPGSFSIRLSQPLILTGTWECTWVSASWPKPPSRNSVYCSVSCLEDTQIGSNQIPFLFKGPPTSSGDPDPVYKEQVTSIIPWRGVREHIVNHVYVTFMESDGTPVPNTGFSQVELTFRQIRD